MRVEVTNAFATRWHEEWQSAGRMTGNGSHTAYTRRVNLFIEQFGPEIARVLKHQLLEALLADVAAKQQFLSCPECHTEYRGDYRLVNEFTCSKCGKTFNIFHSRPWRPTDAGEVSRSETLGDA